jgi:CRP-like cAMP-binding protein
LAAAPVDIITGSGENEQLIARHGPGRFLGELNLLTGLRVFVSARVAEPGEVIVIPAAGLRHVIANQPSLSDVILAAFIARRTRTADGAHPGDDTERNARRLDRRTDRCLGTRRHPPRLNAATAGCPSLVTRVRPAPAIG